MCFTGQKEESGKQVSGSIMAGGRGGGSWQGLLGLTKEAYVRLSVTQS